MLDYCRVCNLKDWNVSVRGGGGGLFTFDYDGTVILVSHLCDVML